MIVVLSQYREGQYQVEVDGHLKCKRKSEARAREFAGRLAGGDDYIDETRESKPKAKAKKTSK